MFRGASGEDKLKHFTFVISGFKDGLARILDDLKVQQDKY